MRSNKAAERSEPAQVSGVVVRIAQLIVLLKLALVLLVFDPVAADTFVLPKSAVTHALTLVLLASLAACIGTGQLTLRWSTLHTWVTALFLAFVLATLVPVDPAVGLFGVDRRFVGLTHIADSFVSFLAVSMLFRTARDQALLLFALAGTTVIVTAYGVLQMTGHDIVTYTEGTTRPIATFGQPDTLGAYVGIMAITCAGICALAWSRLAWPPRALLATCALLAVIVTIGDGARASVLSVGSGALTVAVLAEWRALGRRQLVSVAVVAIGVVLVASSAFGGRLAPDRLMADRSLQSRLLIWQAGASMVASRPLLGVGPDNFAVAYPSLRDDRSVQLDGPDVLQNSTHSWFVYVLTSTGLIGGLALVGTLAAALFAAMRLRRSRGFTALAAIPLAAFLGQGLVTVTDPALDWVVWCSLGVLAAGVASGVGVTQRAGRSIRSAGVVVAVGLAVLAAGEMTAVQPRIAASEAAARAERALADKRPLDAVREASAATRSDPRRATYWGRLGGALAAAGNHSAAETAYLDASRREPWQPLWWRNVAIERLNKSTDVTPVIAALKEAVRLDSHDVASLDLLARLSVNAGDDKSAATYGERAVALYPSRSSLYTAPVSAEVHLKNWDAALRLVDLGISQFDPRVDRSRISDLVPLHLLRARVLIAAGRGREALPDLEAVFADDPTNPDAIDLKHQIPVP